jgi:cell division protein FtsZ
MIQFDLPKEQSSILKVVGVGGGGGNAVNHMYSQTIDGVDFIICNTDAQALANSKIPNRIQLGPQLTSGLGAGANPEIGRQATEESLDEIKRIIEVNTKMVFITAGMGGGTGTGGAPIIAKTCKDMGMLTVGIVTMPFAYEGKKRHLQAEEGIKQLKQYVDTLLVISNDKLRHQFGNLKMREAFEKADNVLATAAKCITDVITTTGQINVDFADVCTVMKNGGVAILGNAAASGENRAQRAIEEALNSPLLNDNDIRGAKWILININSAEGDAEFTMDEVEIIQSHLISQTGENTDVILGMGYDSTLGDNIGITIIATGFENKNLFVKPVLKKEELTEGKIVMMLNGDKTVQHLPNGKIKQPDVQEVVALPVSAPVESPAIKLPDPLAPVLVDETPFQDIPMPTLEDITDNREMDESHAIHYDLSGTPVAGPVQEEQPAQAAPEVTSDSLFYDPPVPGERVIPQPVREEEEQVRKSRPSFLSKPLNIYEEEYREPVLPQMSVPEKEDNEPLELVEKEVQTEWQVPRNPAPVQRFKEERSEPDEMEVQKRKQLDRLQKLRSLSFNVNTTDPTDEFENIPAYIRRNMELYNQTAHIESFYSKFEVSADDKNQGQINTINSFLDGKKPD